MPATHQTGALQDNVLDYRPLVNCGRSGLRASRYSTEATVVLSDPCIVARVGADPEPGDCVAINSSQHSPALADTRRPEIRLALNRLELQARMPGIHAPESVRLPRLFRTRPPEVCRNTPETRRGVGSSQFVDPDAVDSPGANVFAYLLGPRG